MTAGTLDVRVVPVAAHRVAGRTIVRSIWAAATIVYLALAAGTAMTRLPYGDEGELASPAYNLVHRGHLEVTQWERARETHKAYWMPPMFFFAQAAWQMAAGFGVVPFRLATVLWGLALLYCAGAIVTRLTGDGILAALIAAALATDYTYLMHAGIGRCEIMSAALAIAASSAYVALRERSLSAAVFTSHLLMTLSGLTHPVGGIMWMPLLLGLQWTDRKRLRPAHYAIAVIPYLAGFIGWGAYIAQDPPEFRRQFFGISLSEHRFAGFADPLTALRREFARFAGYYGVRAGASWAVRLKAMLPLGYIVGIGGAVLFVKRPFIRACLLLLAAQLFILTFLEGTKQSHYIVDVIPTLVAILVAVLWALYSTTRRQALVAAVALVLAVLQIGPVVFRIREDAYHRDFLPAIEIAKPYVDHNDLVMAGPEYAIPFNFPENVVSRPDYGYRTGRNASLVLTSVGQLERNTALAKSDPAFYRYMSVTFSNDYRLLYQRGDVAVYRRAR